MILADDTGNVCPTHQQSDIKNNAAIVTKNAIFEASATKIERYAKNTVNTVMPKDTKLKTCETL